MSGLKRQDPQVAVGQAGIKAEVEQRRQIDAGQQRQKHSKKLRQAKRPKATYDLPPELIEAVSRVAIVLEVSASSLAAWMLVHCLGELLISQKSVSLESMKERREHIRSTRFLYRFALDGAQLHQLTKLTKQLLVRKQEADFDPNGEDYAGLNAGLDREIAVNATGARI